MAAVEPAKAIDEARDPRVSAKPIDGWEWAILAALALLSLAVLVPLLVTGRTISGADGSYPPDQLQYMAWIRDSAEHWLMADRYDFLPDNRVFLHPGFFISGRLYAWLGLPIQAALLAWKPVCVLLLFFGFRGYVRRLVPGGWPARIALVLALFFITPWSAIATQLGASGPTRYSLDFIAGEVWTSQALFGYLMTGVSMGLMPIVLIGVAKFRRDGGRTPLLIACSLGAAAVTWLQPWQGAEVLITVLGVELWRRFRQGVKLDLRLTWVFLVGSLPAAYYAWIGATDASWEYYAKVNQAGSQPLWSWPLWMVAISLAPLLVPALFAYRGGAVSWQSVAVRIWPFAVAIAYFQPSGSFPYHAVQGLALPLSILAVQGFTTRRPQWLPEPRAWWVVPAVVVLTLPGTAHRLKLIRDNSHAVLFPYYVFDGEERALSWLDRQPQGGVLSNFYGGLLVPGFSGQESYIGQFSLTPDFDRRAALAGKLLAGGMSPSEAQSYVASTGATYLFQPCHGSAQPPRSLAKELGPLVASTHDFGCARVYVLKRR